MVVLHKASLRARELQPLYGLEFISKMAGNLPLGINTVQPEHSGDESDDDDDDVVEQSPCGTMGEEKARGKLSSNLISLSYIIFVLAFIFKNIC